MQRYAISEANSRSASQILRLLWNPEVYYRVHKDPPLVRIPNKMNPVHTFPPCYPKINSRMALPSTSRSSEWSLPFLFFE